MPAWLVTALKIVGGLVIDRLQKPIVEAIKRWAASRKKKKENDNIKKDIKDETDPTIIRDKLP